MQRVRKTRAGGPFRFTARLCGFVALRKSSRLEVSNCELLIVNCLPRPRTRFARPPTPRPPAPPSVRFPGPPWPPRRHRPRCTCPRRGGDRRCYRAKGTRDSVTCHPSPVTCDLHPSPHTFHFCPRLHSDSAVPLITFSLFHLITSGAAPRPRGSVQRPRKPRLRPQRPLPPAPRPAPDVPVGSKLVRESLLARAPKNP